MEPVAAVPAPVAPGGGRRQRRLRNYLLNAPMQLRFASYLIGVGVALSLGLGFLLFRAYSETSRVIALSDPDTSDGIALALASEDRTRIVIIAVVLFGVLVCLLASGVVVSHRIAGPAFALSRTCKQVAEGNLARPRPLRPRDLLIELGNDVSNMVDALRDRETRERDAILAAASAVRASNGSQAVETLEQLAREKGARLS
jgi:HAMP domain-containing protein